VPASKNPTYMELCEKNLTSGRRPRLCDNFYREAFSERPDAAMFFYARVVDQMDKVSDNSAKSYWWYATASRAVVVIAVLTVLLGLFRNRLPFSPNSLGLALIVIVGATVAAFGWLNQWKAEYRAWSALVSLRDRMEVEFVDAAASKRPVAALDGWLKEYRRSGTRMRTASRPPSRSRAATSSPASSFRRGRAKRKNWERAASALPAAG
jgi:hypothetical protein